VPNLLRKCPQFLLINLYNFHEGKILKGKTQKTENPIQRKAKKAFEIKTFFPYHKVQ
jgi:hypothetical protein